MVLLQIGSMDTNFTSEKFKVNSWLNNRLASVEEDITTEKLLVSRISEFDTLESV